MGKHKYSIPNPTSKMDLEPFSEANPIPKSRSILIPSLTTQIIARKQNSSFLGRFQADLLSDPQEPAAFGRPQLCVGGSKTNCETSVQTQHKGMTITAGMKRRSFFFPCLFFQEGISSSGIKVSWMGFLIWEGPRNNYSFFQRVVILYHV